MTSKSLFILLMPVLFALNSYAQKVNHINIPFVRESEKIDTLLNKFVNLGDPGKSCFVLYADPIGGMYGLTVKGVKTDTTLLRLDFLKQKAEFGYFYYKRFIVIVVNLYDEFNFFDQTIHSKSFKYLASSANTNKERMRLSYRYFCSADFIFPDGHFWPEKYRDSIENTEIIAQAVIHNRKIDSLLDKYVGLGDPSKSCFKISSEFSNDGYSITISGIWTNTDLLNMNVFWQKPKLGYFWYKGYLVIVELRQDPKHFFLRQGKFRKFRFEFNEHKSEDKELNPLGWAFCNIQFYQNKEGEFEASTIFGLPTKKIIKGLNLPIVKEGRKIDSLLDKYAILKGAADTCIMIFSGGSKDDYDLSIEVLRTDTTLVKLHFYKISDLKFFRYKGMMVFLKKDGDPYNFFPETLLKEKIRFEIFEPEPEPIPQNLFWQTVFKYESGEFKPAFIPLEK